MYRATPITYFVKVIVAVGIAGSDATCTADEVLTFDAPRDTTCRSYLEDYLSYAGGRLLNPDAVQQCQVCATRTTDDLLATFGISYNDLWRSIGITLVYSVVNIVAALGL